MIRVLLAGLALVLVAFTFDASVLFVPAVALVVLCAVIPPWIWLAARGAAVSRRLHAERVAEEQPLEATIELTSGPLGLAGGEVLDQFTGATMRLGRQGAGRAGRRTSIRVVARFPRRGRVRFEPPALRLQDPLGLLRIEAAGTGAAEELLVLPRTERIEWPSQDLGDRPESPAEAAVAEAMAATEVDGLRPYRPGTPASRIHWAALARGAGLLERRLRVEASSGPLVVLDGRTTQPPERFDEVVRAAASLTLHLARDGGCELLLPGERRPLRVGPDLTAWPEAHARLALVEGGADAPPPAIRSRPPGGRIFYVAAAPERVAALPSELRTQTISVAPASLTPADGQVLFEVSGCRATALDGRRARRPRERAA